MTKLPQQTRAMIDRWAELAAYLGYHTECEMLKDLYDKLITVQAVADHLGYDRLTVRNHLLKCGVTINQRPVERGYKKGK